MRELFGLLSGMRAIGDMTGNNYDSRKVARDEDVNGLTVSTAYTSDEGYETALIDSDGKVYPVQRYEDREASQTGHQKWLKFAQSKETKITMLDGLEGCVPAKKITLKRGRK